MTKFDHSILFLGKKDDQSCEKALRFCRENFPDVHGYLGQWEEPFPEEAKSWEGDYIISYLSRWVVPEALLRRSKIAAFNFHPATPDYPGIGCNNFALYDDAKEYGVTCHYMEPKVDTGTIIAVERFPVTQEDTVASLLDKTYACQLDLFHKIMNLILKGEKLPTSDEKWTRAPFTRKEFDMLGKITPDMSEEEVRKRVRATNFGVWKPSINLYGYVFELKTDQKK